MSAPLFFIIRPHFSTRCYPWRRPPLRKGAAAFLLLLLPLFVMLFLPGAAFARSTIAVVDNEPVDIAPGEPGPGDNMVFSVRRNGTFVVSLAFTTGQQGEIVSHRLQSDGQLELVGRTPGGAEPRAIAMARNGDFAVVVNSIANQVAVMSIGDDGLLREVSRTSSEGLNPYDVAVAFGNTAVVANRDSDQINTFHIDRDGTLTPIDSQPTGIFPHSVAVSRRYGLVAVANQIERSVSLYELDRQGKLTVLRDAIPMTIAGSNPPASMVPRTLTWHGRNLFVALDGPFPTDDMIRPFSVSRGGEVTQAADVAGGAFLTDIEANEDGLFAVTANRNVLSNPIDDRNEVRVYRINGTSLTLDASVQTEGFPPSFKQVSTGPAWGLNDRHVIVSEFQSGWLLSLIYNRDDEDDEEEEEGDDEDDDDDDN